MAELTRENEYEMTERYNQMLDDVYGVITIAGMEHGTAYALREIDPIAYRTGLFDYVDSLEDEDEE